jgi:hypothetical protein
MQEVAKDTEAGPNAVQYTPRGVTPGPNKWFRQRILIDGARSNYYCSAISPNRERDTATPAG